MTTKQIAEAVGKPEKTVRTWAFKAAAKSAEAAAKSAEATPSHPADWSLEETIAIIEIGMGKNAAELYRQNARQTESVLSHTTRDDLREIIKEVVATAIPAIIQAFQQVGMVKMPEPKALPLPPLEARSEINKIVSARVKASGCDYRDVWNELYREALYRLHVNLKLCAENRGMKPLDYAEEEGYIAALLSIARAVFGEAA